MAKLTETNKYLKDPKARAKQVARSVAGSSAIEGIYVSEAQVIKYLSERPRSKKGKVA